MSTTGPFVSAPAPTPTPSSPPSANSAVIPAPPSPPAAAVTPSRFKFSIAKLRDWATPLSILVLAISIVFYTLHGGGGGSSPSAIDGVALGRSYAPLFLGAYASAWDVAADQVVAGKSIAEAQKAMMSSWKGARYKAFEQKVVPAFSKVLSEGAEPRDDTQRREVARVWRDFAKGLRKGN